MYILKSNDQKKKKRSSTCLCNPILTYGLIPPVYTNDIVGIIKFRFVADRKIAFFVNPYIVERVLFIAAAPARQNKRGFFTSLETTLLFDLDFYFRVRFSSGRLCARFRSIHSDTVDIREIPSHTCNQTFRSSFDRNQVRHYTGATNTGSNLLDVVFFLVSNPYTISNRGTRRILRMAVKITAQANYYIRFSFFFFIVFSVHWRRQTNRCACGVRSGTKPDDTPAASYSCRRSRLERKIFNFYNIVLQLHRDGEGGRIMTFFFPAVYGFIFFIVSPSSSSSTSCSLAENVF